MSVAYEPEIFGSAIVAVGSFNPAIFSPDWLERNELLGAGDADTARDESHGRPIIVSRQVSTFETDWFALQVFDDKFSLTSRGALSPAFKDLAVGVLQLVPHTPVTAVGLNFMGHYKLASEDQYHRVGDTLAPKDVWKALYPDDSAGMSELTMLIQPSSRGAPLKTKEGKRISVQPSTQLTLGIYLSYNDHHEISAAESNLTPAERAAMTIDEQWESSWKDAIRLFNGILSLTLEG